MADSPVGISGRITRTFQDSQLTPLLALAALLLGVFAILVTPREEEPQIDVTFANVIVPFPGGSAEQVENLVTSPMEQILSEIAGVEHIVSASRPGLAVLTVQFKVGEKRTESIVRLYNAVYSNQDWQPPGHGVLQPLIKPKGIDDVPILALTLWSRNVAHTAQDLAQVARTLQSEIQRVPGTRNVYTLGGPDTVVQVQLDPQKLAGYGMTANGLVLALQEANVVRQAGDVTAGNRTQPVQAGSFLASTDDVANLVVGVHSGHPVYLQDVADVRERGDAKDRYVWFGTGPASTLAPPVDGKAPAITIAIAKKPGENASDIAARVIAHLDHLKGSFIPDDVELTVTRNYGVTANEKATKLIQKLVFVTAAVVVLVMLAMGMRVALIIGAAVVITLAATLFASWAWGFTINRVSLFALIFAIGILVDDAIVVVENIHRHLMRRGAGGGHSILDVIPRAVDEVGGPTILATFTVIAALLPMAFVSGLMGPYMSPIPINASMGMVISLAVALIFTPWACRRFLPVHAALADPSSDASMSSGAGNARDADDNTAEVSPVSATWTGRLSERLRPLLDPAVGRQRRHRLYGGILLAIAVSLALAGLQWVVFKMLPFDNKSEFQVVVNMPEGTPVERTLEVLDRLAAALTTVPEVLNYQLYAGLSAPINFNGLVRQYDLRRSQELGDIQVNLLPKGDRHRKSHEIARAVRPVLAAIGARYRASVQVVEVPPGPPVQAPLVAEIYAPDRARANLLTAQVRAMFNALPDVVDADDSREAPAHRLIVSIDTQKAALLGVSEADAVQTLTIGLAGSDASFMHMGRERRPIPIRVELAAADKGDIASVLELEVPTRTGHRVPLSEVVSVTDARWDATVYHKDLLPLSFVTADMAGPLDSPLYGMFALAGQIGDQLGRSPGVVQYFTHQPDDPNQFAVKWDGEWQVTYETFRDMGIAYAVGLALIYLLLVAQFKSYLVPVIIMTPIPLTVIGVMPGHALLGAQFTATSMIGMIALAGIIVRNSILLVDFINVQLARGVPLADAVLNSAAVRARPIVLTGLAAITGALFILDDPIFNGLAIALIFGILVSTLLTLVLIPLLYFGYRNRFAQERATERTPLSV